MWEGKRIREKRRKREKLHRKVRVEGREVGNGGEGKRNCIASGQTRERREGVCFASLQEMQSKESEN